MTNRPVVLFNLLKINHPDGCRRQRTAEESCRPLTAERGGGGGGAVRSARLSLDRVNLYLGGVWRTVEAEQGEMPVVHNELCLIKPLSVSVDTELSRSCSLAAGAAAPPVASQPELIFDFSATGARGCHP